MRRFPSGAARRAATAATIAAGSIVSASLWFGLGLVCIPAPTPEPLLEVAPPRALGVHRPRQVLGTRFSRLLLSPRESR